MALALGGCLLADVGIDPELDDRSATVGAVQGGGSGGSVANGSGGGSGSGAMAPEAGSGGGGSEGNPSNVTPPAQGGSAGLGTAGSANMPPAMGSAGMGAGTGGSGMVAGEASDSCPETTDKEEACIAYCELFTEICEAIEGGGLRAYDYENQLDCVERCVGEAAWEVGTLTNGDTVMCRCLHSYLAATQGANTHCYHARREPTGMCL